MNIVILSLNYLPESTSIGPYSAGLAEFLAARGHDVRVVTGFPIAPQWKVWDGYRGKAFMQEYINGIPVLRTFLYMPKDPRNSFQRILFDCSFALSALAGCFLMPRPDWVVAISPPLQLSITGHLIAAIGCGRLFLHIQDLMPDAAIAIGALRSGSLAAKVGRWLERWAYRKSAGIGVISQAMRNNLLAKNVPPARVFLIPNYIDPAFIHPEISDSSFRTRFGIEPDEFLVMYSGSVAGKQGLHTFVEAGAALNGSPGIACCLIGEGPYLADLKEFAEQHALHRFLFLPLQPRDSLSSQLAAADALVITQRKAVTDMVFPGKLLYYMAAGRAILAAVSEDSETARFIRENEVGVVVPPEDARRLAEAILWMRANPERTQQFGRNGRRLVREQFNREVVLEQLALHLEAHAN